MTSPTASLTADLRAFFTEVRAFTDLLVSPLQVEDTVIQSMPDVSPTKWHMAHTSWFFETFLLEKCHPDYRSYHPKFSFIFNSYYNAVGPRHSRPRRGLLSRPTLAEVCAYRKYIDERIVDALERGRIRDARLEDVLMLGIHHEQQHQELLLTDIKHVLSCNPLSPVYAERPLRPGSPVPPAGWQDFPEGLVWIGHEGGGFSYDNESPRHRRFNAAFSLGPRLVTNGEYMDFIADGGYERPELWLSDGHAAVAENGWTSPLYWDRVDGRWHTFSLAGFHEIDPAEPVCHVSYYEADAYARWAGARLPNEAEWETAADGVAVAGNLADERRFHPEPLELKSEGKLQQIFGDVWEWTSSSYDGYPGYRPAEGALGEYNGKFMCNQFVLRGGSCATSRSHLRKTYRNFFPPEARWQFTGIRLAR